jgi:polyhydroxybutyrate depolymerase
MNSAAELYGGPLLVGMGSSPSWNAGPCCGYAAKFSVDDVGFPNALLSYLEAAVCFDLNRVFATGMSNGAMLCYRLLCECRLSTT